MRISAKWLGRKARTETAVHSPRSNTLMRSNSEGVYRPRIEREERIPTYMMSEPLSANPSFVALLRTTAVNRRSEHLPIFRRAGSADQLITMTSALWAARLLPGKEKFALAFFGFVVSPRGPRSGAG